MTPWINRLLWLALGVQLVAMAILASESLPPAWAVQQMDLLNLPDGWTFLPGCVSP